MHYKQSKILNLGKKHMKKSLLFFLVLLIIFPLGTPLIKPVAATTTSWWDEDWDSRKTFVIEGVAGAGENYQMKFVIRNGQEVIAVSDEHKGWSANCFPASTYEDGEVLVPVQALDGDVRLFIYDALTGEELHNYKIDDDPLPDDGHSTPIVWKWIGETGTNPLYVSGYGTHAGAGTFKIAYSSNQEDWTTYTFPISENYTYPSLFQMNNDPNLYLFIRKDPELPVGIGKWWQLFKCTDPSDSATWSLVSTVLNNTRVDQYLNILAAPRLVNSGGRFLVTWNSYNLTGGEENWFYDDIMCATYSDDLVTWYDLDGTPITLPVTQENSIFYDYDGEIGKGALEVQVRVAAGEFMNDKFFFTNVLQQGYSKDFSLFEKTPGQSVIRHNITEIDDYECASYELFYNYEEQTVTIYPSLYNSYQKWEYDIATDTATKISEIYPPEKWFTNGGALKEVYPQRNWVRMGMKQGYNGNIGYFWHLISTDNDGHDFENTMYLPLADVQSDFADIRFIDEDDETELDYWTEFAVNDTIGVFWVKIAANLSVTTKAHRIYIYYNNPDATTESSGADTWIFFDDFTTDTSGDYTHAQSQQSGDYFQEVVGATDSFKVGRGTDAQGMDTYYQSDTLEGGYRFRLSLRSWTIPSGNQVRMKAGLTTTATPPGDWGEKTDFADSDSAWELTYGYGPKDVYYEGLSSDTYYILISTYDHAATNSYINVDFIAIGKYVSPEPGFSSFGNYEVTISNMEGCGNWIFEGEKYYHFEAIYFHSEGITSLDTVKIKFSDGVNLIQTSYDVDEDSFILESGNEQVILHGEGDVSISDIYLTVTFDIYLKAKIFDCLDIDIYMWSNTTYGYIDSWEIKAADYFHIYNLGGQAELTTTGYGGRSTGGDVFELWAGQEGYTELLYDDFERDEIAPWGVYAPNSTHVKVEMLEEKSADGDWYDNAVSFSDESDEDGDYGLMWNTFHPVSSGVFYVTFHFMPLGLEEDQSFVITNSSEGGLGGPWVYFADDNKLYYVNSTGDHIELRGSYGKGEWKNITFAIDVDAQLFDFYYNGDLQGGGDLEFYAERTSFDTLYTSTYLYDSPHTNNVSHGLVTDVRVWLPPLLGDVAGTSETVVTFRKLQHIHSLFAVGFPRATEALDVTGDWYVEWGIDTCFDDVWQNNTWKVRLDLVDANIAFASFGTAGNNWIQLRSQWYENDTTLIDTEYFYVFWEGGPGGLTTSGRNADYFRVYLDLWFNRVNASSTIGGRISSYYYGMTDKANPWWSWLPFAESDWEMVGDQRAQTMYFADLKDIDGNVRSCRESTLMRIRTKVWRSADYGYMCRLEEFDLLNYEIAAGEMRGIDTPIFTETRLPTMPTGGFFAALAAVFSSLVDILSRAFGPGILAFFEIFLGFTETVWNFIGDFLGIDNLGTSIRNIIELFPKYLSSAITTLIEFLTVVFQIFVGMATQVGSIFLVIGGFIASIFSVLALMSEYLGVAYGDLLEPMIVPVLALLGIFIPFWELERMQERDGMTTLLQDLNNVANVGSFVIDISLKVVKGFMDFIFKIIQSVPGM